MGSRHKEASNAAPVHQARRESKIRYILDKVLSACCSDNLLTEEVLISQVCMFFSAGHRYVREILQDLYNTGLLFKDESNFLFDKKSWEAEITLRKIQGAKNATH